MMYNFDNIVGFTEEKEELMRLCRTFNNKEEYIKKGAKLPKGVILYGPPGNGKTLFAKVMASVCDLHTIKIDLGNVVNEKSVCKWITNAFDRARKRRGYTMIFFDEIDKVLPDDYSKYNSQISKTILAQLLTQIDGMDSANNVVFVATCNNYANLPKSLVRSGRIDKKIKLSSPNFDSRLKLIKYYQSKTKCQFELQANEIAKLTTGFSCSAIEGLINECVLHLKDDDLIDKNTIYNCISEIKNENIVKNPQSQSDEIFACRNIGAFVVSKNFNFGSYMLSLEKNTVCNDYFNNIISEYDCDYSGDCCEDSDYDEEENDEEDSEEFFNYYDKEDLLNTITVLLGGYAAEEIILDKIFDNVGRQLSIVDDIIKNMLYQGLFGLELQFNVHRELDYTWEYKEMIFCIANKIRNDCYEKAKKIISANQEIIKKLIPILIEKRNIDNIVGDSIVKEFGGINKVAFLSDL